MTNLWVHPFKFALVGANSFLQDNDYKSLSFYLQEQPTLLTDLLTVLIPRIDHSRVVRMFRQVDHIPLIRSYLIAVQHVGFTDVYMAST